MLNIIKRPRKVYLKKWAISLIQKNESMLKTFLSQKVIAQQNNYIYGSSAVSFCESQKASDNPCMEFQCPVQINL